MLEIDTEGARKSLTELLDRAHKGEQIIVKKHGVPYAAIIGLGQGQTERRQGLLPLGGTGSGLWGKAVSDTVEQHRQEW